MAQPLENPLVSLFPYERSDVLSIQEVQQQVGWNITAFDLPEAWAKTQGEGVKVAVLDSGADTNHPDLINNLLPGVNVLDSSKTVEDDCGHGCVSASTLVHTNTLGICSIQEVYDIAVVPAIYNQETKSWIKDVRKMDIRTYSCNKKTGVTELSKVEFLHKTLIEDEVSEISMEGIEPMQLTNWHKVYLVETTQGGRKSFIRKRADEVVVGDKFFRPNGPNCGMLSDTILSVYGTNKYRCNKCNYTTNRLKSTTDSTCKKCFQRGNWSKYTDEYPFETDLSYITGIVLTDGHINEKRNRVEISSNTQEILQKTREHLDRLGFYSIVRHDKNRCSRLICDSKELVSILKNIGLLTHKKTYDQSLPSIVGMSPPDIIMSFLAGVIDGDGCIDVNNVKNRITTASKLFAYTLRCLLNSMGYSASVIKYKNYCFDRSDGKKVNQLLPFIYNITFSSIDQKIANHMAHPGKISRVLSGNSKFQKISRKVIENKKVKVCEYFYDFTVEKNNNYVANGVMVSNTHAIGIICAENNTIGMVGVAPKSKVIPIKCLDKNGNGSMKSVLAGMRAAIDMGADIISMSLGTPCPLPEIQKLIQEAAEKGIPTFVAAGNAGNTKDVFYPSAYPEAIAIGAINENFERAKFSNTGRNLDFLAPGVDILSTVPEDWYSIMSGTSMATPWVVGIAALLLSACRKYHGTTCAHLRTVEDYRNKLREHTIHIKGENAGQHFFEGYGIISVKDLLPDF